MDAEKLAVAIAATTALTGMAKKTFPKLEGRWTQVLALVFSIGGAFAVTGGGDALTIAGATLAIFGGAVTVHKQFKMGQ